MGCVCLNLISEIVSELAAGSRNCNEWIRGNPVHKSSKCFLCSCRHLKELCTGIRNTRKVSADLNATLKNSKCKDLLLYPSVGTGKACF